MGAQVHRSWYDVEVWTPPERIKHAVEETRWPDRATAEASLLFSPVDVGAVSLTSRTWVPAMVPWRATGDGAVTEDVRAWYSRFAQGKPGALVVEATGIRDIASGPLLRIGSDAFLPGLTSLRHDVERASEGETRLFIQLIDFLAVKRRPDPVKFFARFWRPTATERARLAEHVADPAWMEAPEEEVRACLASQPAAAQDQILEPRARRDLRFGYREQVDDLHLPHIEALPRQLPRLFADAAVRAQRAGFDGVELHFAHAYTMASFLSKTNQRTDGYGGSLRGRLRLPLEVVAAVRDAVGANFTLGCRMLGDEVIAGGTGLEEASEIAATLADGGLDFISVSKGGKFDDAKMPKVGQAVYPYTGPSGYECMPTVYSDQTGPFGRNVSLAGQIRRTMRARGLLAPVVTAGGIHSFDQAEKILRDEDADIIGAARQSLADPDWFEKIRTGHGAEIRRCKFTNYCEALDNRHLQVTCQLWDREGLDAPDVRLSHDNKRRLVAPDWRAPATPRDPLT